MQDKTKQMLIIIKVYISLHKTKCNITNEFLVYPGYEQVPYQHTTAHHSSHGMRSMIEIYIILQKNTFI